MDYTKIVLMPVRVPAGDYCWGKTDGDDYTRICEYFSNDRWPLCSLLFHPIGRDKSGRYPKPDTCLKLKEEKSK
jgi:hypothetical protein